MQFKALLHSSSSPYILTKQNPNIPAINSPFNVNFKRVNFRTSRKLHCISANPELEAAISSTNGSNLPTQMQETAIQEANGDQKRSGSLGNRGLWEQMVEIIKFSGPATGIWICGPLMGLIDTAIIGQGSSIELAALGPGTVLCDYLGFTFMFLSIATSNMVATSLARKDEDQVQHQISMLIFVGLASGIVLFLLTKFFGVWALTAFVGQKNLHLVPAANTYIQIRALVWPAILVGNIAQSASLGMKNSLGPLKALLIASAINAFGDIVLCTFLGYGIAGAAWATAVSQVVAAYTMMKSLNKKGYNSYSIVIPSLAELQEVFSIAAPVFITMISKVGFYALMIYFATSMGTITVAAHQVLSQMFTMCSVWGEPLSQTAQSFMPELLFGIDQRIIEARGLLRSLLIIGAAIGLTLATVATSIPWLFPNVFTADPAVIAEMRKVSIFYFLALSITPCILSCEGTLLAGRDLKFFSTLMASCFLMGALCLKVMANQGLGIVGCWAVLVGFQWARLLIEFQRLVSPNGVLYSKDVSFWIPELKAV